MLAAYITLPRRTGGEHYHYAEERVALSWAAKIFFAGFLLGFITIVVFVLSYPRGGEPVTKIAFQPLAEKIQGMTQLTGSLANAIFVSNSIVIIMASLLPLALGSLDAVLRKRRLYAVVTLVLATPVDLLYRLISRSARSMKKEVRLVSLAILVFPIVVLSVNGFLLGLVAASLTATDTASGLIVFAMGILPHGAIELPVTLFASSLGYFYLNGWISIGGEAGTFPSYAIGLLKRRMIWLTIAFLIGELLVAAYIEAEITSRLMSSFTS